MAFRGCLTHPGLDSLGPSQPALASGMTYLAALASVLIRQLLGRPGGFPGLRFARPMKQCPWMGRAGAACSQLSVAPLRRPYFLFWWFEYETSHYRRTLRSKPFISRLFSGHNLLGSCFYVMLFNLMGSLFTGKVREPDVALSFQAVGDPT